MNSYRYLLCTLLVAIALVVLGCKSGQTAATEKTQNPSEWLSHELPVIKAETEEAKKYGDQGDDIVREAARTGVIKGLDIAKRTVYVDGSLWSALMVDPTGSQVLQGSMVNYILRRINEDRFDIKVIDSSTGEMLKSGNVGKKAR
ncbi:MAG TPA: hypothetical protein VGL38_01185 [bacterium]|jgi:hypothetical protein